MKYFKPISISLSPNVEPDDVKLALNLIVRPWFWKNGKAINPVRNNSQKTNAYSQTSKISNGVKELEDNFKKYLGVKHAVSFNSGRSALYAVLKSLNLEKNINVLLQAFTCNAAINPILWLDLKPIYVDCNKSDFNIDIDDLRRKIAENPGIKVLMIQHTFGQPCNMDEVMAIVRQYELTLIEDCAHSLGAEFNGQKIGTFGRASFFSFGRDKVISSIYGGMAATNDDELAEKLERLQKEFGQPSSFWIFQQMLHPILMDFLILPIYSFLDLGKIFLVLSQLLHILSKAVSWKEKRGLKPDYFPKALPNALAIMAQNQFKKLEKFNEYRQKISESYYENLKNTNFILPQRFSNRKNIFLRFTAQHPKAHEILYEAWHKRNILLGDWYTSVIAPFDTKLDQMRYEIGSCKNAEKLAKATLNLPTHINISQKDAERIVNFLRTWK